MRLIFLGTGSSEVSPERTNFGLILLKQKWGVCIDAGDETVYSYRRLNFESNTIKTVFISHFHSDHFVGLPGILTQMYSKKRTEPITLIAPPKVIEFVKKFEVLGSDERWLTFDILYEEIKPNKIYRSGPFEIKTFLTEHCEGSVGFEIYTDSKKICYSGDTYYDEKILKHAMNSDALIIDAALEGGEEELAKKIRHMTGPQAAKFANKTHSKKIFFYQMKPTTNIQKLKLQSEKICQNIIIPSDGDSFDI